MEHKFWERKGTKGFSLIVLGWPAMVAGILLLYAFVTISYGRIFGMAGVASWWLLGFNYALCFSMIFLGILHWKISRKWNLEKEDDEFGEKVLFVPVEFWAVIPFSYGLWGIGIECFKKF